MHLIKDNISFSAGKLAGTGKVLVGSMFSWWKYSNVLKRKNITCEWRERERENEREEEKMEELRVKQDKNWKSRHMCNWVV